MHEAEKLTIISEIMNLKARYCRLVDIKDWAGFEALFVEDATFETPATGGAPIGGRSEIVGLIRNAIGAGRSLHLAYLPEIEVVDASTVKAIWGLESVLASRVPPGAVPQRDHAFTHDTYVRRGNSWLVQSVKVERTS